MQNLIPSLNFSTVEELSKQVQGFKNSFFFPCGRIKAVAYKKKKNMIELQDKIGSPPNQCKGLHSKTFEKLVSNPFLYAHSSSMCLNDLESVLVCHSIGLFSK